MMVSVKEGNAAKMMLEEGDGAGEGAMPKMGVQSEAGSKADRKAGGRGERQRRAALCLPHPGAQAPYLTARGSWLFLSWVPALSLYRRLGK